MDKMQFSRLKTTVERLKHNDYIFFRFFLILRFNYRMQTLESFYLVKCGFIKGDQHMSFAIKKRKKMDEGLKKYIFLLA